MDASSLREEIAIAQSIHRDLVEMTRVLMTDLPIYQCRKCWHVSTDKLRAQPCQQSAFIRCPADCDWAPMTPEQGLITRFHLFDKETKQWICNATVFDKMLAMISGQEDIWCRP